MKINLQPWPNVKQVAVASTLHLEELVHEQQRPSGNACNTGDVQVAHTLGHGQDLVLPFAHEGDFFGSRAKEVEHMRRILNEYSAQVPVITIAIELIDLVAPA